MACTSHIKMLYNNLRNIFRAVFSVKAIMILRLMFGFYAEIFSSKILNKIALIYCFTCIIGILLWLLREHIFVQKFNLFFIPVLLQFIITKTISLYTKDESFRKFCNNMNTIDRMIGLKSCFKIKVTNLLMMFCLVWAFLIEGFIWVYYCRNMLFIFSIRYWIVKTVILNNHLYQATTIVTYELLWFRIKHITETLNRKCSKENLSNADKIYALKKFVHHYKNILDSFSITNRTSNIVVRFIFNFLQLFI